MTILDDRRPRVATDESVSLVDCGTHACVVRGQTEIASDSSEACRVLLFCAARIAEADLPPEARVAVVGGGLCVLPRVLALRAWGALDVYELEPALVRWVQEWLPVSRRWRFVVGDYRETLVDRYDLIVYDLAEPMDARRLSEHLAPGGAIITPQGEEPCVTESR
jgi:spermidine synthase